MKKIRINGQLFKHVLFIAIYLRMFFYFVSSLTVAINNVNGREILSRVYYYSSYIMIGVVVAFVLVYLLAFIFMAFLSYLRLFLRSIKKELWVIKIEQSVDTNDKNDNLHIDDTNITYADDIQAIGPNPKSEGNERHINGSEYQLDRHIKRNIFCLFIMLVISFLPNLLIAFLG